MMQETGNYTEIQAFFLLEYAVLVLLDFIRAQLIFFCFT